MGKPSRDKGARGEREVVEICRTLGLDVWRTPNSGGLSVRHGKGDIRGIPGVHIEVKRAETLKMDLWSRQCEADADPLDIPVVVYRRSNEPWRASLPLPDLLDLLVLREEMAAA